MDKEVIMKYLLIIFFTISLALTISCRKNVVDGLERITTQACGCNSEECAEQAWKEYQDFAMKYIHEPGFRNNLDKSL